jgi:hypothetical protein
MIGADRGLMREIALNVTHAISKKKLAHDAPKNKNGLFHANARISAYMAITPRLA